MMTSGGWSIVEDIPPLLAFATAMIAVLLVPVRQNGTFSLAAKTFFGAAIASYLISTIASILSHWRAFPASLQPVVTSVEVLWMPFVLFGVYAVYSHQQLTDAVATQRAIKRSSEMLESVVETTPSGILVLNDIGQITFANGEARRLLDIEDEVFAVMTAPEWSVCLGEDQDGSKDRRCDFRDLLQPEPLLDALMVVRWPNGWTRRLVVNTAPYADQSGNVTGAVAAFVEREPWQPSRR
jgi:PAS domain-containing protein